MGTVMFQKSATSQAIADRLQQAKVGDCVSYQDISMACGKNVQSEARSAMAAARRQLLMSQRMVFGPVKNVGLKRLSDSEVVATGAHALKRINRTSKRGAIQLSTVQNYQGLTNDERVRYNTAMSMLGVFYEVTKTKSLKQIEAAVAVAQRILPLKDTLRAFGGS